MTCDLSDIGERMLSLLMIRDTRVEDTWPATESCSDTEDEATPLVRLPLVLPPARILLCFGIIISSYPVAPSLVLLSTLSMLDRRDEQPEPAILL